VTGLDIYQPATVTGYEPGMVMTPEAAKALDEQVRLCTAAVLREGVDYGHIPGTSGEEKSLWRPGAQKLLQWFRLECICDRIEVERDDEGRKHGITYRAEVGRGLKTATPVILATCEGTADYDESKFYQSEEQVKARLRELEHKWAAKDRRAPNADRWNSAKEYRADWNALMKRAQKRAIVGAVVDATAAGGIFTDREEDDSPAPQDGEPGWYEQALERALTFTDIDDGNKLYAEAILAKRDRLASRGQADHVQNRVRQRVERLRTAQPVDVEELAQAAQASPRTARRKTAAAGDDTQGRPGSERQHGAQPESNGERTAQDATPRAAGAAPSRGAQPLPPLPEDQPGSATEDQLQSLHIIFGGLGFKTDDREHKLKIAETITGRAPLHGPARGRSSKNLSFTEARKLIDTLSGFGGRDALIAFMAEREQAGDGDA
jgi:hypothetical protein